MDLFSPRHLLIILVVFFLFVFPFWKIFRKAGHSGWFSLLMFVPIASTVALYWLALATWPLELANTKRPQ